MADQMRQQAGEEKSITLEHVATMTRVVPVPAKPDKKDKQLPPFKVLLHNDDVNTFEHVVQSVMKLTGMVVEDAFDKTMEAHEKGMALLVVTHKERAELYHEQFQTYAITTTIEVA